MQKQTNKRITGFIMSSVHCVWICMTVKYWYFAGNVPSDFLFTLKNLGWCSAVTIDWCVFLKHFRHSLPRCDSHLQKYLSLSFRLPEADLSHQRALEMPQETPARASGKSITIRGFDCSISGRWSRPIIIVVLMCVVLRSLNVHLRMPAVPPFPAPPDCLGSFI